MSADATTEDLLPRVPRAVVIGLSLALAVWVLLIALGLTRFQPWATALTAENGVLATLTVVAYLAAGLTMLRLALPSASSGGPRRRWLLLLGASFLFIAAEETDWGQTYLKYDTPETIRRSSTQGQVSVHNLKLPLAPEARWANHASWLLTVLGGIALPVLLRFGPCARRRLWRWQTPLPPWISQAWLCVGALIPRDVFLLGMLPRGNVPSELREFSLAVAVWAYATWRTRGPGTRSEKPSG